MSGTPTLSAPGIVLRPLALSDAPALFFALSDPDVQHFRQADAHRSVDETARYIEETLSRSRAAWAITQDGHAALGRLALRVNAPDVGEFGIVIRRSSQRRGLGRNALRLAEVFAFETLGLSQLIADIDAENEASLALFTHAGFTERRRISARRATKLGVRDSIIMAKLPNTVEA